MRVRRYQWLRRRLVHPARQRPPRVITPITALDVALARQPSVARVGLHEHAIARNRRIADGRNIIISLKILCMEVSRGGAASARQNRTEDRSGSCMNRIPEAARVAANASLPCLIHHQRASSQTSNTGFACRPSTHSKAQRLHQLLTRARERDSSRRPPPSMRRKSIAIRDFRSRRLRQRASIVC